MGASSKEIEEWVKLFVGANVKLLDTDHNYFDENFCNIIVTYNSIIFRIHGKNTFSLGLPDNYPNVFIMNSNTDLTNLSNIKTIENIFNKTLKMFLIKNIDIVRQTRNSISIPFSLFLLFVNNKGF